MPLASTSATLAELPPVLSVKAACAALAVSRTTIYQVRAAGQIGFAKVSGRSVIPRSEVARVIADLERQAAEARGGAA
jgi:excisionase family DNA binding protein